MRNPRQWRIFCFLFLLVLVTWFINPRDSGRGQWLCKQIVYWDEGLKIGLFLSYTTMIESIHRLMKISSGIITASDQRRCLIWGAGYWMLNLGCVPNCWSKSRTLNWLEFESIWKSFKRNHYILKNQNVAIDGNASLDF